MANNTINNFETLDNHALEQVVGGSGWMDYINGFLKGFGGQRTLPTKDYNIPQAQVQKKGCQAFLVIVNCCVNEKLLLCVSKFTLIQLSKISVTLARPINGAY